MTTSSECHVYIRPLAVGVSQMFAENGSSRTDSPLASTSACLSDHSDATQERRDPSENERAYIAGRKLLDKMASCMILSEARLSFYGTHNDQRYLEASSVSSTLVIRTSPQSWTGTTFCGISAATPAEPKYREGKHSVRNEAITHFYSEYGFAWSLQAVGTGD